MSKPAWLFSVLLVIAGSIHAADLTVVKAGPTGEIASLAEANEIRVAFSDPMVVLGRIPDPVRAPFFHISPAVEGTFRWSGTTLLIFTPKSPLPYSTRYDVTIDAGAKSVDGSLLPASYDFSFTTPTVRLKSTVWYRKAGRYDGAIVIGLRFNQPVSVATFSEHYRLEFAPHAFAAPLLSDEARRWLAKIDPTAAAKFDAKVAAAGKAASATGNVVSFKADDWDHKRIPSGGHLVVLETRPGIPPQSWIRLRLDEGIQGTEGAATPGTTQSYTIQLPRAFFVDGFRCGESCDPEGYNPIGFRAPLFVEDLRPHVRVWDITDPHKETELKQAPAEEESYRYPSTSFTFDDLGFRQQPGHRYAVAIDGDVTSETGEKLGATWMGIVGYAHARAFTSFGDGHGVWESKAGTTVPFYARNMKSVREWIQPIDEESLVPTLVSLEKKEFHDKPAVSPIGRDLPVRTDAIQSYGLDLARWLHDGKGIVWASIEQVEPLAGTYAAAHVDLSSTLIQVTNLGISVKDSPENTLVFVTRLDDGSPVAGAEVKVRNVKNEVVWTATTGRDGVAFAPGPDARGSNWWELSFVVTASKGDDFAYLVSNWNEGLDPWSFDTRFDLDEKKPLLRGVVFSDRGVYKAGEEIHFKAILRSDTVDGIKLLPKGTNVQISLQDSQGAEVDKRTVATNEWSSAEWTTTLRKDARLGQYTETATVAGQTYAVQGGFLVAAYRRPDFRVDADLSGEDDVAGATLSGRIDARYLFGAPMDSRPVRWTFSRAPVWDVPAEIRKRFGEERFHFLGWPGVIGMNESPVTLEQNEGRLTADGVFKLDLQTRTAAPIPYRYTFEGEVTDVSRQTIANRASMLVHPAEYYVGFKPLPFFVDKKKGIDTELIAVRPDGTLVSGANIEVKLTQIQWNSVRRAEGNGFYTWETEKKEIDRGTWTVTTANEPVPLHVPVTVGGYYVIRATSKDSQNRTAMSWDGVYVLGDDYTAWERYDNNHIDLVPEKKVYQPGETARIMIKSPWEKARALMTIEREGVKHWQTFELRSTSQTIEVPITEREIPNVYVSVLLIRGRTDEPIDDKGNDPGKPAFRLGYVELKVEDATRRLKVDVKANREEYRPATEARIDVDVHDHDGKAVRSEVTLWAVDYGVLSLTAYQAPDVVDSVWVEKALQVMNEDSREKIISRRVVTPKGGDEGGGGGREEGPGMVRKDFRVLAFWLGSIETNRRGHARTKVKLPESLTTYRIMAVAGDRDSRFGAGKSEIRINKPVLLTPAFPRFLALGDTAHFGAVIHSQLAQGGKARVTIRSLDPDILEFTGSDEANVDVAPKGSLEVRFDARAKKVGTARLQLTVKLRGETDALEDSIPVRLLASPETVAAYGETKDASKETVEIPSGVVPEIGGLHVELASTAMVGLGEGARYLVEYPYGCAEQRASRTIAMLLTADLGGTFNLPGIDPKDLKERTQTSLSDLPEFQCPNGGFSYWKGECMFTSPFLTSYVVHVLQTGKKNGYTVSDNVLNQAYWYLESQLATSPPVNEGWWPSYTAWQAYAVKVLVEGGRNEDSHLNRIYGYLDRMPVFALSYLYDAMIAKGQPDPREAELLRRIGNSILPEGGSAHVEELADPYLLWFWNSNVRSTAVVLRSMVTGGADRPFVRGMVRWLMKVRKKGRWGNTQENALAMEALVAYYRKYESEIPDFKSTVTLGTEQVTEKTFQGRSTEAQTASVPMATLLAKAKAGDRVPLVLAKEGTGTLFWMTRLKYASADLMLGNLDSGFHVERSWAPRSGPDQGRPSTTFKAGELVTVTLEFTLPKERRYVAVVDPLPAGFEPVEALFATTATDLAREQTQSDVGGGWFSFWQRGGFDHVERHDDRVVLYATRLSEGEHVYKYVVRATTAGTFRVAPAHAEEMYEPEVFGRTKSEIVTVEP